MSAVEKNWQTTRATIRERSKFMFDNDLFSDVKFVVAKAVGERESKHVVSAHKLVLSISSPVFEAMFYGELAETGDTIELPDCEYDSLLELFRYRYSDEVILSGSNVMGVLYLAKKYMVPSLANKCTEYLKNNLDPSNVFSILPSAEKYQEKTLVDQCWKVIDKQTEEAVNSDGFATIERSLLEEVVIRGTLKIEEIELFKAVDLWATKQCEIQGVVADGATKRRILGEDVIKGIELPDCEYDSLLELFRYIYNDEVILSGSNVMGVLYLANKYMVPSLANKCTEYLQNNLNPSNVFSILPSAEKYQEKTLVDQCWKLIDKQTEEVVKSDEFATIERSSLEAVVVRDSLTIEEIELFKAVDLWATKQCEKQGLATDGVTKRRILGEEVIKEIRFPTMKQEDFATVVLDSEILRKKEIVCLVKCLNSASRIPVGFPETKRSGFVADFQRCCRFGSLSSNISRYNSNSWDGICFSVDKDIELRGVCLFGSENNTYEVDLKIHNTMNHTRLVFKTGQFISKLLRCDKYSYRGFEMLFDEKVYLKKNTRYSLFAEISGPDSLCGKDGVSSVKCGDVTFTFYDSCYTAWEDEYANFSCVKYGQIPELRIA